MFSYDAINAQASKTTGGGPTRPDLDNARGPAAPGARLVPRRRASEGGRESKSKNHLEEFEPKSLQIF